MSTLAEKLRAVADLLEQHPDLPTPCVFAYSSGTVDVSWQILNDASTKDDQKAAAIAIRRALGGTWRKEAWDNRFDFYQERDGLNLQILASREQICERIVVGSETVTVPAVAAQPEHTEVREVVEWRCEPLLANESDNEPSAVPA